MLVCDDAVWHKSAILKMPPNIAIQHIRPYTPEMNPIEQVWMEIMKLGFRNEVFEILENVADRLCATNIRFDQQTCLKYYWMWLDIKNF